MGVHGLWEIVGPTARPVRVESLRNKRLAVDASIWIYQFMKAVRDAEGNQMKNSHIVGFFRRICKLIYLGIKPVFVFDGGVPALKRDTIRKRKEKREGNKETIQQTAQKLLAKQLQNYADGKQERPKVGGVAKVSQNFNATRQELKPDGLYYDLYYDDVVDEGDGEEQLEKTVSKPTKERERENTRFKQQDEYHLPKRTITVDEDDNRLMTENEYTRLTREIDCGLSDIDLDNINPQSKEFSSLPLSTQYIVLSHLRLRSRLRMGYTKEQLQTLFPDPMEFSKFQIQMVQKRNYFTQKIMNVTGMDGDDSGDVVSRSIASDRNRAYNLQKVGNGYALTISNDNKEGKSYEKPVFLDADVKPKIEHIDLEDEKSDASLSEIDWNDETVQESGDQSSSNGQTKVGIPNALFVQDSDDEETNYKVEELSDPQSDDESFEMEDVTDAPLSVVNNTKEDFKKDYEEDGEEEEEEEDDDDDIMKEIKSLYDYSNRNNKNKSKAGMVHSVSPDEDIDNYEEIQTKHIEEDELKQAIEKSKEEYMNMLTDEKEGKLSKSSIETDAPFILSSSTLAKTFKLPNFSMKNNLLFGGKSRKAEVADVKTQNETSKNSVKDNSKPLPLPLPKWFSSNSHGNTSATMGNKDEIKRTSNNRLTEDEKAGIVSYGEIGSYFSSDDDENVEYIDTKTLNEVNEVPGSVLENSFTAVPEKPVTAASINEKSSDDSILLNEDNQENRSGQNKKGDIKPPAINQNKKADAAISKRAPDIRETVPGNNVQDIRDILGGNNRIPEIDEDFEFSDDEETELLLGMQEENRSYKKFAHDIKSDYSREHNETTWTYNDEAILQEQLRRQKRDSDEVSTQMIYDVQDLLSRFGIPFITAPMEAEAQCAELKLIGLVDGIITDDSDCFLFGGDKVYKNLFNDKHFVECYQISDLKEELGLTRDSLIDIAILLGSDYTEGIKGIGKVMAMEILGEFKTLEHFRDWWQDYQNGKIDENSDTPIRRKLRKSLRKFLFLESDFPNKLIYEAYKHPEVDHDKTSFKWGSPDLDKLRTYFKYYVGWDKEKVDEIIVPVIKNMNKPQMTIEEFFPVDTIRAKRKLEMSKRIQVASDKLKKYVNSRSVQNESANKRQKV